MQKDNATTEKDAAITDETDFDALLDELPDPTPDELKAAGDEFFSSVHLSAPTNWQERADLVPNDEE